MNTKQESLPMSVEPTKQTLAGSMIREVQAQRTKCDALTDLLFDVREHLENFEGGSAEIWQHKFWVNLHHPKSLEAAKAFCRAWGGNWTQTNDGSSITYRGHDERGTVNIHRVESYKETPVAL